MSKKSEMTAEPQDPSGGNAPWPTSVSAGPEPRLDTESRDAIAGRLKQVYVGLLNEPMPDRFKSLLDQLAKSERET